jgi:hypothetical protein
MRSSLCHHIAGSMVGYFEITIVPVLSVSNVVITAWGGGNKWMYSV